MQLSYLVLGTVLVAITVGLGRGADPDPIKDRLEKAKTTFDKEMKKVKDVAKEYFDKQEKKARDASNKKLVDKIKDERKAFDDFGVLSDSADVKLQKMVNTQRLYIEGEYKRAIGAYTKAKKDDLAASVEKELSQLYTKGADGVVNVAQRKDLWIPLFNGKDLDNWSIQNGSKESWKVVDGAMQGECKKVGEVAYLSISRMIFDDFHLRMELMYNPDCICRIFFRVTERGSYWADLRDANSRTAIVWKRKTPGAPYFELKKVEVQAPPAKEWFTYEIIARGNTISILVNGVKHVDSVVDEDRTSMAGGLMLDVNGAGSLARFRKIEIIPLPPLPVKK